MLNYKPHELGVIILAGGRGTRMGGRDKGSVRVRGERLVDVVRRQLPYGAPVCVVSPFPLGLPQVCENPLFGGPAAGIAAGLKNLEARSLAPLRYIAVLSVDAPDSPQMLPKLLKNLPPAKRKARFPR
ncbi:NTP transferase domain-containing protein [Corynebacterium striatum]|uniref:NTP transferase domain-containing protein n=1 Tax=Corynebacterium striatum TaxID=43770 RepID=UPI003B58EBEB